MCKTKHHSLQYSIVSTDSLIEYARNPRKNDAVVDKMVACIKEFGFRIPIVAKSDGSVVDGHLRLKAAKKLGLKEVPVVIADWAEWDEELVRLELEEDTNFDLNLTGFDLDEIDRLLQQDKKESAIAESSVDDERPIISKVGDLWLLGEHRLLCGDATKLEDVKRLMNGHVADMIFTDPPYNVKVSDISGLGKIHHQEFAMASGEMTEQEFIDFLSSVFSNLATVSKDGSIHYICMDWKHIYEIIVAGRNSYTEFKQLCVWNKGTGGMGTFYRSQHELIFVFKNGTAKHTNNFELGENGRYRTNVWDYAGMNNFATDDRDELLKMHPTVKSLQLVIDAILDCSNYGETILDLFGGSGTTLIASEETHRKCCMMELDPKYVDTIVRRWQKHTGKQAIHAESGKMFDELETN